MAWTTPITAVANSAFTAAQFNASVRDNLLETAPAKATTVSGIFVATGANSIAQRIPGSDTVPTLQTTGTTSFVDLATVGPQVTLTTGANALVMYGGWITNSTAGSRAAMSYAVSGANTIAAADTTSMIHEPSGALRWIGMSRVVMQTGMSTGSTTFTCKYKALADTANFQQRMMAILPL
jgi:hypothetical protein